MILPVMLLQYWLYNIESGQNYDLSFIRETPTQIKQVAFTEKKGFMCEVVKYIETEK